MRISPNARRVLAGRVVGVGLGKYVWVGSGMVALLCMQAMARPEGERVVSGSATFQRNGNSTLVNTATNNTIIDYSSFNIGMNESVRFQQPSDTSRVLNRVPNSVIPSSIDGQLSSNGIVYISNASGIYFGRHAIVDAARVYAAAGNISNSNFLNNVDHFTDIRGDVVNQGQINADTAALIGRHVSNSGRLSSPNGLVVLAAGDDVYLTELRGHMMVQISNTSGNTSGDAHGQGNVAGPAQPGVDNSGTISARQTRLSSGDLYSLAIRMPGTINSSDVVVQSHGSGVVNISGTINASNTQPGQTGGSVDVLGERVVLRGATIDASGAAGGGTVRIGGDFQGRAGTQTAQRTIVDFSSAIRADATENGDGGRVIVWSERATGFGGEISTRGGSESGKGGFVEVSSRGHLGFGGTVITTAAHGATGTLLLDPTDIRIVASGGTTDLDHVNEYFEANDPLGELESVINASLISGASTNVILQATHDITFDAPININTLGIGLTAQAGNTITVSPGATITTLGGDVIFQANHDFDLGGMPDPTGMGGIVINAAINTTGVVGAGFGLLGLSGAVNLTVEGGTGSIAIAAPITTRSGSQMMADLAPITLTVNGGGMGRVLLGGNLSTDGADITVAAPLVLTSSVILDTSMASTMLDAGSITLGAVSASMFGFDLTLNTSTTSDSFIGGSVTLGAFGNAGNAFVNDVSINTDGSTNGDITLTGNIFLDGNGPADPASFTILSGTQSNLILAGDITIDTEQFTMAGVSDGNGGSVDIRRTTVSGDIFGRALTIDTSVTNPGASLNGGAIQLGEFAGNAALGFVNDVLLNSAGSGMAGVSGTITLTRDILLDASGANLPSFVVTGGGNVFIAQSLLRIDTEQPGIMGPDGDAGPINFGTSSISASIPGAVLEIDTSATGLAAGAITIRGFNNAGGQLIRDLTLDTRGATIGAVSMGGTVNLTGNFSLLSDAVVTLASDTTIDTDITGGSTGAGSISFAGASINGAFALALDASADNGGAAGDVALNGAVNGLMALTITGDVVDVSNVSLTGNASFTGNDVNFNGAPGGITSSGGMATITIQPLDPTVNFSVGTGAPPNMFSIDNTTLGQLGSFAGGIILGRLNGTGLASIGDATFTSNITIRAGSIDVDTLNAGANAITLIANTGLINEADLDAAADITGGAVTLTSVTGIGTTFGGIETDAASLTLNTTGIGAITVTEADAVTVNATTASGAITITNTTGNMTLGTLSAGASGTISLTASGGGIVDDALDTTSDILTAGAASLTASTGIGVDASGPIDTAVGSLSVSSNTGGISITELNAVTLTSGTIITSGNLTLALATPGDITVVAASAPAGSSINLSSTAGGAILDDGNDLTVIAGDVATLTAATGIGTGVGGTIDTTLTSLTATTTVGDVNLHETNGLTLTSVATTGTGNINVLSTSGDILVGSVSTGSGSIALTAASILDDAIDNVPDVITTGAATLTATGSIGSMGSSVDLNVGTLSATATNGSVNLTEADSLTLLLGSTAGDFTLAAGNDIILGSVTSTSGTGAISLTATAGSITDDFNDGTSDINSTSGAVTLVAGGSIGSVASSIDTTVGALTATAMTGGVTINEADTLTLTSGSAGTTFSLTAGGPLTAGPVTSTGGGAITLTTDTIDLTGAITTSGGTVTLQPLSVGRNVSIGEGAVTDFALGTAELARITDGSAGIFLGRSDGIGAISISTASFQDPVTFRNSTVPMSGGTIAVNGAIMGTDNASIHFIGSGATTTLNANISTINGSITFDDSVLLGTSGLSLSTLGAGNNIVFNGKIDGTGAGGQSLTLSSLGTVVFNGNIGGGIGGLGGTRVGDITVTAPSVQFDTGIVAFNTQGGDINLSAVSGVVFNNNMAFDTDSATSGMAGDILFGAATTINTFSNSQALFFDAGDDGNVAASGGLVTFGPIGTTPTKPFSIFAVGREIVLNGDITVGSPTDAMTVGNGNVNFGDARVGRITLAQNIIIDNTLAIPGMDTFDGAISLRNVRGDFTLNLIADAGSALSILGAVGDDPFIAADVDTLTLTSGGVLTLGGRIETDTEQIYSGVGGIVLDSDVTLVAQSDPMDIGTRQNITLGMVNMMGMHVGNDVSGAHRLTVTGATVSIASIGQIGMDMDDPTALTVNASNGATIYNAQVAGPGPITITADTGDILFDTLNAGTNTVTLTATTGLIDEIDGADDTTADLIAGAAILTSSTGIGTSAMFGAIETSVTSLDLTTTSMAGGAIAINEADAVLVNAVTANGSITIINTTDNMTLDVVSAGTGGTISLTAMAGAIVDDAVDTDSDVITTGAALLSAFTGIGVDNGVVNAIDTEVGSLSLSSNTEGVNVSELDDVTLTSGIIGTSGNLTLTTRGNLPDTTRGDITVVAISAPLGTTINLTSTNGAIFDDGNETTVIAGDVAVLTAALGIGAAAMNEAVDTTLTSLTAVLTDDTADGDVFVHETNGLTLTQVTTTGAGNINVISDTGDIILGTPVAPMEPAVSTGSGTITLTASAGQILDDVDDNVADVTTTGLTSLRAMTGIGGLLNGLDLDVGTVDLATSNTGRVNLNLLDSDLSGSITVNDVNTTNGPITIFAQSGNIIIAGMGVTADSAPGNNGNLVQITAQTGSLIVNSPVSSGVSPALDNGNIILCARVLDINEAIRTNGGITLCLFGSVGPGGPGNIGVGDVDPMTHPGFTIISNADLALINSGSLIIQTIGGDGVIIIDNVARTSTNGVAGLVTFNAAGGNNQITFEGGPSSFRSLAANADNGIIINADNGDISNFLSAISTSVGDLMLNGNANSMSDDLGNISLAVGRRLFAGRALFLNATGGITGAGRTFLEAAEGIVIGSNLTSTDRLFINADANADGVGTLTIAANTLTTTFIPTNPPTNPPTGTSAPINIVAADVILDGSLNSGAASTSIDRANTGSARLGATAPVPGVLWLDGDELSRVTANGFTFGGNASLIEVDGITADQSDGIAGIFTIRTNEAVSSIRFENPLSPSFFGALRLITGDLTVESGVFVTGEFMVDRSTPGTLGLGIASGDMMISNAELTLIHAADARFGATGVTGEPDATANTTAITVESVAAINVENITGTVTLDAIRDDANITFSGGSSTFRRLTANADNGIIVTADLSTTIGNLALNGDADGAIPVPVPDSADSIVIADGRAIFAGQALLLSAARGGITGMGVTTLVANEGIVIGSNLTSTGLLTLNSDINADGFGALSIAAGTTTTTVTTPPLPPLPPSSAPIDITAADIILAGSLDSGSSSTIIGRADVGTARLGGADPGQGVLWLDGGELDRISATGFTFGGGNVTLVEVDGITTPQSAGIIGIFTISALGDSMMDPGDHGHVSFINTDSFFRTLSVRANDGISINRTLTTTVGAIDMNGDANSPQVDTDDTIVIAQSVNINSAAGVSLSAAGGVRLTGNSDTTNMITGHSDAPVTIGTVQATNGASLTVESEGNLNVGNVNIGAGLLMLTADTNNDGLPDPSNPPSRLPATLTVSTIASAGGVLINGADMGTNDNVINLVSDINSSNGIIVSNAGTVNIGGSFDTNIMFMASDGAVQISSNVGVIRLLGANVPFDADPDHRVLTFNTTMSTLNGPMTLAPINVANSPDLNADPALPPNAFTINLTLSPSGTAAISSINLVSDDVPVVRSGDLTVNGALSNIGSGNIDLSANSIFLNDAVHTEMGGSFTATLNANDGDLLTPGGLLTITDVALFTLDGAFSQVVGMSGTPSVLPSVSFAGSITTTGDDITFASPVTLTGSIASLNTGADPADAGNIRFMSQIMGTLTGMPDAEIPISDLTLTAGVGNIRFDATVGAESRPLDALLIQSAADVTFSGDTFSNSLTQVAGSGTTTFTGAIQTNGADGINLVGNNFSFVLGIVASNSGGMRLANAGTATFTPAVDKTVSLDGRFLQDGTGPVMLGVAQLTTTNDPISFSSAVTLTNNVTISSSGGAIDFSGAIEDDNDPMNTVVHSLRVEGGATGDVRFLETRDEMMMVTARATVGMVRPLQSFFVSGKNVTVLDAATMGGNITLLPLATLREDNEDPDGTESEVPGASSGQNLLPDGVLTIQGNLTSTAGGIIRLVNDGAGVNGHRFDTDPDDPDNTLTLGISSVATIVFGDVNLASGSAGGSFTIDSSGDVTFGDFEKVAVFGSLTILSPGTVRLTDMSAIGNIIINGPSGGLLPIIQFVRRPGAFLFDAHFDNDTDPDKGPSITAGGSIELHGRDGTVVADGTGDNFQNPTFGATDIGNVTGQGSFLRVDLAGGEQIPDADRLGFGDRPNRFALVTSATGAGNFDLAASLAGALPRENPIEVGQETTIGRAQREVLESMKIYTRDLTAEELQDFLSGRAFYNDTERSLSPDASDTDFDVTINRLYPPMVTRLVGPYLRVFYKPKVDPDTGEETLTIDSNGGKRSNGEIRKTIADAITRFMGDATEGTPDPIAFREYLETTPEESQALFLVDNLGQFLTELELLGLGPAEEAKAREAVFEPIRPAKLNKPPSLFETLLRDQPQPVEIE